LKGTEEVKYSIRKRGWNKVGKKKGPKKQIENKWQYGKLCYTFNV
jgi:hypothetical protein